MSGIGRKGSVVRTKPKVESAASPSSRPVQQSNKEYDPVNHYNELFKSTICKIETRPKEKKKKFEAELILQSNDKTDAENRKNRKDDWQIHFPRIITESSQSAEKAEIKAKEALTKYLKDYYTLEYYLKANKRSYIEFEKDGNKTLCIMYAPVYVGEYNPTTTNIKNISASIPAEEVPESVAKDNLARLIKEGAKAKK